MQLNGSRWARKAGRQAVGPTAPSRTTPFSDTIHAIYRARGRVALSILLQFAGWIVSGVWLWVMLRGDGPVAPGLWTAIAIQALVEGLRSALVFIPASIGVQEAGYAAVAPVFGLTPEIGLAVSLLRRARDIVVAVPVLLVWQVDRRPARGPRLTRRAGIAPASAARPRRAHPQMTLLRHGASAPGSMRCRTRSRRIRK